MVVVVEMDHGRLKHRSQTPSRIPVKVTSVSPAQQKESSLRSVSAGPRERPVNTPVVSGSAKNAQKGVGRSKTPNRLPASVSSTSIKKLCSPPKNAQAPSPPPLSWSLVQQAKTPPTSNATVQQPLSSLPIRASKLSSPTIPSTYHNAEENPSKTSRSGSSGPNLPTLLLTPAVVSKVRSPTLTKSNSSTKLSRDECPSVYPKAATSSGDGPGVYPKATSNAGDGPGVYPKATTNAGDGPIVYPKATTNAGDGPSVYPKAATSSGDGGERQQRRRRSSEAMSSVSGSYPVPHKTPLQEFHAQRKVRISGYGRNPCLVKASSCIVPELLPRVPQSTWDAKKRCGWITLQSDEAYVAYHDEEWGVPVHDDKLLFELLVLQGAQAELSQPRILTLRENFRAAFDNFDPALVAKYDEEKIATLKSDSSILIPETKMRGAVENAKRVLEIVDEYGSFSIFLWGFVNNKPSVSHYKLQKQVPVKTPKSEAISKELLQRGFQFVGPTVMYSVMQAAGMVSDHLVHCFRHQECADLAGINIQGTKRVSARQTQRYRRHSQEQYSSNRRSQQLTSWVDALNFPTMFGFQSPFYLTPYMNLAWLPIIEEAWEKDSDTDIESEI